MAGATASQRLPKAAIGIATIAMAVGATVSPSGSSPGQSFLLLGIFWTGGALVASAVVIAHWLSAQSGSRLRGAALAAAVVSGGVFLLGLAAWAALATWGCLFNPDAPWSCPIGN